MLTPHRPMPPQEAIRRDIINRLGVLRNERLDCPRENPHYARLTQAIDDMLDRLLAAS